MKNIIPDSGSRLSFSAEKLSWSERYRFLVGGILPRPIAWVSTRSGGRRNLAPFSFFTAISADPWLVCFCPMINSQTGKAKDTLEFIKKEKIFGINIVSMNVTEKMNITSQSGDQDEFTLAGLSSFDGPQLGVPLVQESLFHFECKLFDLREYGTNIGGGSLVVGQVEAAHIHPDLWKDNKVDTESLDPVGRLAGQEYSTIRDQFTITRK